LRETIFSIFPTNIDDKKLTKNREHWILRVNMNLLWMRFWSFRNEPMILNYCGAWSYYETDEVWRVKIKKEGRERYGEVGRVRKIWVLFFCSYLFVRWGVTLPVGPSWERRSAWVMKSVGVMSKYGPVGIIIFFVQMKFGVDSKDLIGLIWSFWYEGTLSI